MHQSCRSYVVEEDGFEPSKSVTTDLQSAPFGHSGTLPYAVANAIIPHTPKKSREKIKFSLICVQFKSQTMAAGSHSHRHRLRRFRWFSVKTLRSDTGKNRQTKKPTYFYADFHRYHYSTPCTILYYTLVVYPLFLV